MKAIAFDTIGFAKRLKAVNFSPEQAETLAEAVAEIVEENLATKGDIANLQRYLKELELRLTHELLKLKHALTLRLGAMLVAGLGGVAAIVRFLGK